MAVERPLGVPLLAWMLILGGIVLLLVDRFAPEPRHLRARTIPLGTAVGIGLCQCLALVPGVSRSGSTIVGALLMGVSKRAVYEIALSISRRS